MTGSKNDEYCAGSARTNGRVLRAASVIFLLRRSQLETLRIGMSLEQWQLAAIGPPAKWSSYLIEFARVSYRRRA